MKNCFCSGSTRKDGSKILCMPCGHKELVERYKTETFPISVKDIKRRYLEWIAYEDYSFAENDGYVDHEACSCKLCSCAFKIEREAVNHFQVEHNNQGA